MDSLLQDVPPARHPLWRWLGWILVVGTLGFTMRFLRSGSDGMPGRTVGGDPLFGEGIGLDSLDAVELVLLLQKHYKLEIKDMEEAKLAFASVQSLADYIRARQAVA